MDVKTVQTKIVVWKHSTPAQNYLQQRKSWIMWQRTRASITATITFSGRTYVCTIQLSAFSRNSLTATQWNSLKRTCGFHERWKERFHETPWQRHNWIHWKNVRFSWNALTATQWNSLKKNVRFSRNALTMKHNISRWNLTGNNRRVILLRDAP